jgi:hypothetical protein
LMASRTVSPASSVEIACATCGGVRRRRCVNGASHVLAKLPDRLLIASCTERGPFCRCHPA